MQRIAAALPAPLVIRRAEPADQAYVAATFAEQVNVIEAFRPPDGFQDAMKGSQGVRIVPMIGLALATGGTVTAAVTTEQIQGGDELAGSDPAVHVLHRAGKGGLGAAYLAGEARTIQLLRRQLVEERGWPRQAIVTKPFWTPGKRGLD